MSTNGGDSPRFIIDHNVAKLALWLRMMGYDSLIFDQPDDWQMVRTAISENRIIITKDTGVMKRRVITNGQVKALFASSDNPREQIKQVITTLKLHADNPFSRCLECNAVLRYVAPEAVKERVPPFVYRTQTQFSECPVCHRVYWRGTHWQKMLKTIEKLTEESR